MAAVVESASMIKAAVIATVMAVAAAVAVVRVAVEN